MNAVVVLSIVLLSCVYAANHSCKDIYSANPSSANGTYTISNRKNQPYKVYCEFHNNFGYTYVSKKTSVEVNINDLFTTKAHVKVRHVKANGVQAETIMENISNYPKQPLGIFYNQHSGYAASVNAGNLAPYLYLGFLPISLANHVNPQGYRASGQDFRFTNCDRNPNSYFVFYFNPNNKAPIGYVNHCCESSLMHSWITTAHNLPSADNMPDEFYFDYELHFGGCGGYAFIHHHNDINGAALGVRFELRDPCQSTPCQNGGSCYSENETNYFCECPVGYEGVSCELKDSCKDIYSANSDSPNGTYTIYNRKNQPYKVYCEFHSKYGYTYISRNSLLEINMDDLFTTTDHAKIRHVKADGAQIETVVENIERYKNISLGIFYNHHPGYATPINSGTLAPYLYLGLLPIQIASHAGDIQGYRASNQDVLFTNCDAQPNSYFVFYFNPSQKANAGYGSGWATTVFMNSWITLGSTLPSASNMPAEFYFDYEIHFGGCGGYEFHHQKENIDGAALGLRFDAYDPCVCSPCQNGGNCRSPSESRFICDCAHGYTGDTCADLNPHV